MGRILGAVAALGSLVVTLVASGPATATFSGRNGLIAFASDRNALLQHPQIFSLGTRGGQARNLSRSSSDESDPAPSPGGRRIAFSRGGEIWLMNADGGGRRLLASGGSHPVWSPDGKAIAYDGGGPGECPPPALRCGHTVAVWTVRIDGSRRRLLDASSRHASWSPDSRRIAYEGGIDPYGSAHGIRVANADGTNSRWISREGSQPVWSRDGHSIAYATNRGIRVVLADGTRRRRLSSDGWAPMWEPRGGRLAYRCGPVADVGGSETSALCVVRADGHRQHVVARGVLVDDSGVAAGWSPHGRRLSYATPDGVFVVGADGSGRKRLARKSRRISVSSLAWSTAGRLVFSEEMRHNDLEIQTVAPDGSGLRPLTRNDNDDLQPSWAPDGKRLAFVRVIRDRPVRTDIWVMNADGSGEHVLVRNGIEPSWTADGARIVFTRHGTGPSSTYSAEVSSGREQLLVAGGYHGTASPDGTKLAFVRGSLGSSRVVVAAADGSKETSLALGGGPLSWSPDSETLVFVGCAPGNVCTAQADGSGLTHLPIGEPWPRSSSFSPDAAAFTFSSGTEYPGNRIEVIRVDGSGRRVVTAARGRSQDPAWQPLTR